MKNKLGHIIYVGKAKNLKKRIYSYSKTTNALSKTTLMVSQVTDIELQITSSENEALILEALLVRKHKPKYNILLKDDKTFPYIEIGKEDFPRLSKVRSRYVSNKKLYGPFASSKDVTQSIDFLQKTFKLRSCSNYFFNTRQRPCILYQINHCSAPCVNKISKNQYQDAVNQTIAFLDGKNKKLWNTLLQEMEQAAKEENFEKAIIYRDRIQAITKIQSKQYIKFNNNKDCDFVNILKYGNITGIGVVIFRKGHNNGFLAFFPANAEEESSYNILERFILDFYNNKHIPETIYVSSEFESLTQLNSAFNKMYSNDTKIKPSLSSKNNQVMQHLKTNLENAVSLHSLKTSKWVKNFKQVQKLIEMKNEIQTIEVYDNSHIQGNSALGAMVFVDTKGFNKNKYKIFSIKDEKIDTKDDYAMMVHVLERRIKRALKENNLPDLIIIDGGKGQLSSVISILKKYSVMNTLNVIAISKGPNRNAKEETIYTLSGKTIKPKKDSSTLHFLQYIRDEVHRFAITSHRKKRMKQMFKNPLEEIEGIGKKRKRLLLSHFGSVKSLTEAKIEDIAKVKTISKKLANKIFKHLH